MSRRGAGRPRAARPAVRPGGADLGSTTADLGARAVGGWSFTAAGGRPNRFGGLLTAVGFAWITLRPVRRQLLVIFMFGPSGTSGSLARQCTAGISVPQRVPAPAPDHGRRVDVRAAAADSRPDDHLEGTAPPSSTTTRRRRSSSYRASSASRARRSDAGLSSAGGAGQPRRGAAGERALARPGRSRAILAPAVAADAPAGTVPSLLVPARDGLRRRGALRVPGSHPAHQVGAEAVNELVEPTRRRRRRAEGGLRDALATALPPPSVARVPSS